MIVYPLLMRQFSLLSALVLSFQLSASIDTTNVQSDTTGTHSANDQSEHGALSGILHSVPEAIKLGAKIAEIETLVEKGVLTEEEGKARIEELEAEFEHKMDQLEDIIVHGVEENAERIEEWSEEFGKKWEERTKELEESLDGNIDVEFDLRDLNLDDEVDQEEEEDEGEKTNFEVFNFHVGINGMRTASGGPTSFENNLSTLNSVTARWTIGAQRRVGGPKSPLLIKSGMAFESLGWSFNNDLTVEKVPGATTDDPSTTRLAPITGISGIRRNRWDLTYLELPLMVVLDFTKGNKVSQGLSIGIGGFGSLRTSSRNLIYGTDSDGDRVISRTTNSYNTHLFRYGVQAQIGFKTMIVSGRLDARPFFKSGAFTEELYVGSLSFGFAL